MIEGTDWQLLSDWVPLRWWTMVAILFVWVMVGRYLTSFDLYLEWLALPLLILWGVRTGSAYRYVGRHRPEPDADLRPDSSSLLGLRHDPFYGIVEVMPVMYFGDWRINWPLVVWQSFYCAPGYLYVSFEMVAQLATDSTLSLAVSEDVAWLRINAAARGLHTVNYDRYQSLGGINVKQDTIQYVFALYKRMLSEIVEDFPRPESRA